MLEDMKQGTFHRGSQTCAMFILMHFFLLIGIVNGANGFLLFKRICCLLISEEKKRNKKVNAFLYILNASLFYHLARAAFRSPFVAEEI